MTTFKMTPFHTIAPQLVQNKTISNPIQGFFVKKNINWMILKTQYRINTQKKYVK